MNNEFKNIVKENLAFIAANPFASYPAGWLAEVYAEARACGILPPSIGCNCRPGIDAGIVYGGDLEDVF